MKNKTLKAEAAPAQAGSNLPSRKEWQEYGFSVPPDLCSDAPAQNGRYIPDYTELLQQRNELLEALKAVMTHFVGDRNTENCVGQSGIAADQARAAIAKAEGRTQ